MESNVAQAALEYIRAAIGAAPDFGFGRCDFVTADNLQASVALLCEFVEEMVALPDGCGPADAKIGVSAPGPEW